MALKNLGNIYVAHEKFDNSLNIQKKVDYQKWVNYIEARKEIYLWFEETELGKISYNLPNPPPNKIRAVTREDDKKKNYSFVIDYSSDGYLHTTIPRITICKLEKLFEMADFLNAYVIGKTGKKILTHEWLQKEKTEILK